MCTIDSNKTRAAEEISRRIFNTNNHSISLEEKRKHVEEENKWCYRET